MSFLPYVPLRSPHYHTKNHKVILNKSWDIGCTTLNRSISAAIFQTKSCMANWLLVIWSLTVNDIYNIQSTLFGYKIHWFFRRCFYYSFIDISCVQTTVNFLSCEIKIHFGAQWPVWNWSSWCPMKGRWYYMKSLKTMR